MGVLLVGNEYEVENCDGLTGECAVKNTIQFKTRREYIPVGSDAASMPHTVLNQTVFFTCALLVGCASGQAHALMI